MSQSITLYSILSLMVLTLFTVVVAFKLPTVKQNQDLKSSKHFKDKNLMVFLGSGGHTGEMFRMLKSVQDISEIGHVNWVTTIDDINSIKQIKRFTTNSEINYNIITLFRARNVGQGLVSSVFSTIKSFTETFGLMNVVSNKPDILLVNGPGTSVIITLVFFLFNIVGYTNTKVVYVESLARVVDLSLSGKLCYIFSDRFIVQWPHLREKYPKAEFYGILV